MAESGSSDAELIELVVRYSDRVRADVLAQNEQDSVYSPLLTWLLLCACLLAAEGSERERLESIVSCSRELAGAFVDAFLNDVPSALHAAIAVWVNEAVITDSFARWRERLPERVGVGEVPTQTEADAWAERNTKGLITRFPMPLDGLDLVLASAVATDVFWKSPYDVVRASDWFSPSSPWVDAVRGVLWTDDTSVLGLKTAAIVLTQAAGLVAVHEAVARENLTVI